MSKNSRYIIDYDCKSDNSSGVQYFVAETAQEAVDIFHEYFEHDEYSVVSVFKEVMNWKENKHEH